MKRDEVKVDDSPRLKLEVQSALIVVFQGVRASLIGKEQKIKSKGGEETVRPSKRQYETKTTV